MIIVAILISIGFAVSRFLVPTRGLDLRDTYKDFAHLWVGGVAGAFTATFNMAYLWIFLALCGVELAAFFVRNNRGKR